MSNRTIVTILHAKHKDAAPQTYKTPEVAFEFLKTSARVKQNKTAFAELWEARKPKRLKNKEQSERDILMGLAKLLASGDLRLKREAPETGASKKEEPPAPPPPPPVRRMSPSGLKIRERPDPTPASPAPPPLDAKQQAAALDKAAESGAAFVEQCR